MNDGLWTSTALVIDGQIKEMSYLPPTSGWVDPNIQLELVDRESRVVM